MSSASYPKTSPSQLFYSSFMLGTSPTYLADRFFSHPPTGPPNMDFDIVDSLGHTNADPVSYHVGAIEDRPPYVELRAPEDRRAQQVIGPPAGQYHHEHEDNGGG